MQGFQSGASGPPPPMTFNNNTPQFNRLGQGYTSYMNPNDYVPHYQRLWFTQGYYDQPNGGYGSGYGAPQWGGRLSNSMAAAQLQQQQQQGPYPLGQRPMQYQQPTQMPPPYGMQPQMLGSDMVYPFLTLDHMKAAMKLNPNPYYYMNR